MNHFTKSLVALAALGLSPIAASLASGCSDPPAAAAQPICDDAGVPRYVVDPAVLVPGAGVTNEDCRNGICRHNENTDLFRFAGAIYFVHRSAMSQILGPNSALHVYRSNDEGQSFEEVAMIPAVDGRDIRDPVFYRVGDELFIKAITRVNGFAPRDLDAKTMSITFRSSDGVSWENLGPIGPEGWGFWRVTEHEGTLYSAAYRDGDLSVVLYRSEDGVSWTAGPTLYDVAADTPLETELAFTPGGRMLGIVRMDGTDEELLGGTGRLRTKLCWADAPYDAFECPHEITGQRLDGAVHFWHDGRLFVVARKHLQPGLRKRTSLFELVGDFERGPLSAVEWAELPSAGDTAYAGVVALDSGRFLTTWYSGDLPSDPPWPASMLGDTDIWKAVIDLSLFPAKPPTESECPNPRRDPPPDPPVGDCAAIPPDLTAFCGFPCDEGNELGVGEYCTTADEQCGDNSLATICSDVLNGSIAANSFYCTQLCTPDTDCGSGASCVCAPLLGGGEICGCTPDTCSLPAGTGGAGGGGTGGTGGAGG